MGKIVEGVWDCAYCGKKKIRGSIRVCPNCGRQRDSNITFYIDDPNNYVPDNEAEKINKNPDWICSYCDGLVSDSDNICPYCNASREDSAKNYLEHKEEIDLRRKKKNNEDSENNKEIIEKQNSESISNKAHSKKSNIIKTVLSIFLCVAIVAGLVSCLSPKTYDIVIDSFSWERSIDIEEYVTVERSDWNLPSNARLLESKTEIRSYKDVVDHYETKTRTYSENVLDHYETYVSGHRDLGNGHFEEITSQRPVYKSVTKTETYQEPVYRSEPVYDTKYYYEIDIWQHCRYVKTSDSNQNPVWGQTDLKELEREGTRTEKYIVHVHNITKDKNDTYEFDYNTWKNLNVGDEVKAKVKFNGEAELIVNNNIVSTVSSN